MEKAKYYRAMSESFKQHRQQLKDLATEAYSSRQRQDWQSDLITLRKQRASLSSSMSSPSGKVPEGFSRYFSDVFSEAHAIMVSRQESYGPGNVENLGPVGVFSRMAMDKVGRISNALNGKIDKGRLVVDENWYGPEVHDALIDTINYAAILIALGQEKWSEVSREEEHGSTRD
jgi:hypothetical protein